MKRFKWQIIFGTSLIALSAIIYISQIFIFKRPQDTFFYILQDLAFVPISVLIVTLILDQLLRMREKRAMLKKMNMVIGAFFSEVGTGLLKSFLDFDVHYDETRENLIVTNEWSEREFSAVKKSLKVYDYKIESQKGDLEDLKGFLIDKREFLLGLLANPNLLEHETFTDLLWAVFHLSDELSHRKDFNELPQTDLEHLKVDIHRAYKLIIIEWVLYMKHLKRDYPYLFSVAVRTNPFNPE